MIYFTLSIIFLWFIRGMYIKRYHPKSELTLGDAIGHLQYVDGIFKNKGKIPRNFKTKYILDGNDYPNGFHYLCYLFGFHKEFLHKNGKYFPLVFDTLLLLITYVSIKLFGFEKHSYWLLLFPFLRLYYFNIGRAAHFSERAFGVFCGNVFLLSLVAFCINNREWYWMLFGLASFTVLSSSSKFAWQAVIFSTALMSLLTLNPFYFGYTLVATLFSFAITWGYSFKVLTGLIRHSSFYKRKLLKRVKSLKENYSDFIFELKNIYYLLRTRNFQGALKKIVLSNNPLMVLINGFPIVFILIIVFIEKNNLLAENQTPWFYISIVSLFLLFLISLRPFQFLGEPERYLEFSTVTVFVALSIISESMLPKKLNLFLFIGFFSFVVIITIFHFYFTKPNKNNLEEERAKKDLLQFLSEQKEGTVLCMPLRLGYLIGYYIDHFKFLSQFSNIGNDEYEKKYSELIPDMYPYPGRDLDKYVKEYNLNLIVFDKFIKSYLEKNESYFYELPENFLEVYSNKYYSVFAK